MFGVWKEMAYASSNLDKSRARGCPDLHICSANLSVGSSKLVKPTIRYGFRSVVREASRTRNVQEELAPYLQLII